MTTPTTPAGWYDDPQGAAALRYWDGQEWTEHTSGPALSESTPATAADVSAAEPVVITTPGTDLLGAATATPVAPRRRLKRVLLAGGTAVVVTGAAVGAYAYTQLSGGGTQPEDVLPAGVIAFSDLDFDPPAGQKVALYKLAKAFPDAELSDAENLKDDVLRKLFTDLPAGTSYDKDIKPWIGERVGVAALAELDENDEPVPVFAVQVKDRAKAQRALSTFREKAVGEDEQFEFVFATDDYVIFAEKAETAAKVVRDGKAHPLSDSPVFTKAMDTLGGDQVATAYVDAAAIWAVVPAEAKQQVTDLPVLKEFAPSGQFAVGLRAGSDHVDLVGRSINLTSGIDSLSALDDLGTGSGSNLISTLPKSSLMALTVSGLGDGLVKAYEQVRDDPDVSELLSEALDGQTLEDLEQQAEDEAGVRLPEDLKSLLGDQTAVVALGMEETDFAFVTNGGDPKRILDLVSEFAADSGEDVENLVVRHKGGLILGSDPSAVRRVSRDRPLSQSASFRRALPDADRAAVAFYFDLQRWFTDYPDEADLTEVELRNAKVLDAVGATFDGGPNGGFHLRVTIRK